MGVATDHQSFDPDDVHALGSTSSLDFAFKIRKWGVHGAVERRQELVLHFRCSSRVKNGEVLGRAERQVIAHFVAPFPFKERLAVFADALLTRLRIDDRDLLRFGSCVLAQCGFAVWRKAFRQVVHVLHVHFFALKAKR